MPHFLLSAEAMFSAAHTLPGVDMCERMHGHNWRVRVTVRVEADALEDGMGVDFRTVEHVTRGAVAGFEHRYLNDLPDFAERRPTAETIAMVICERVAQALEVRAPTSRISEVELWEMPQYRVVYRPA
ncbi:MAG TPA: 6-carboxytetrahydropterin synthase [Gemmatimonadales bacterium]